MEDSRHLAPGLSFLGPYRRITTSGRWIAEVDGLRFIAIFTVFLFHVAGDILRHSPADYRESLAANGVFLLTQQLQAGVSLFFLISGFILGMPFAAAWLCGQPAVSLPHYFLRRLTRLEPPFVVSVLVLFLLHAAGGPTMADLIPRLAATLAYVHNAVFLEQSLISEVAWSLEIEVQFYLLAPVLARVFSIRPAWLRRVALVAAVLVWGGLAEAGQELAAVRLSLLGHGHFFLAGFLLADVFVTHGRPAPGVRWDLFSLAGWIGLGAVLFAPGLRPYVFPILAAALCYAGFGAPVVGRLLSNPWIATAGGMCYSIYLVHNALIQILGIVTGPIAAGQSFETRLVVQVLLMGPVILLAGAGYFRAIERPCMQVDWPRSLASRCSALAGGLAPRRVLKGKPD